jgi:hypothetical protein
MSALRVLAALTALAIPIAEASASSRFETAVFTQVASSGGERTEVSGLELRWRGAWERISLRVAVPWVRFEGSGVLVQAGGGWVTAPGGSGEGNGSPGGNGPGGPERVQTVGTPEEWEASGLGDARLTTAVRVGRDRPSGIWSLHGGVKVPTADESEGLGTGETDGWFGVTWLREGWHADVEAWAEWCALGDPSGYDLEDGPAGGVLVRWPVRRIEMAAGADAGSAVASGLPSRRSAVLLVRGGAGRRTVWEVEARAGLSDASPDVGVAMSVGF